MTRWAVAGLLAACGAAACAQTQSTFDFRSTFRVNLHHFLYEQALSKSPEASDSQDWQRALAVYRRDIVKYQLLSRDIAGINVALSDAGAAATLKESGLSADLVETLDKAAPVYRARWWPQHDRANQAWIAAAIPLVAKHEDTLRKELARAYQTPWPAEPIRTEVAEYASWSGAYTVIEPTLITVSSSDPSNQGAAALEVLFHEASHGMIRKVSDALEAELDAEKKQFPRRAFWHAVLFYTAGEFARRELEGYTPYAIEHGLYDRGWPGALPILEKDWKPYLDGKIDLAAAVRRLVADYGVPRAAN